MALSATKFYLPGIDLPGALILSHHSWQCDLDVSLNLSGLQGFVWGWGVDCFVSKTIYLEQMTSKFFTVNTPWFSSVASLFKITAESCYYFRKRYGLA